MTKDPYGSLDLLLNLLDAYKPHLKQYKTRTTTWERILSEYNSIAGTDFKQYRTLKSRFEKIIDVYRSGEEVIKCEDPELLYRLVNEYNRPYRLIKRQMVEQPHNGEMSYDDLTHIQESSIIRTRNSDSSTNSSQPSDLFSRNNRSSVTMNIAPSISSTMTSTRSSTSPYITPLDTITLGMPRNGGSANTREYNQSRLNPDYVTHDSFYELDDESRNVIIPPVQYSTNQHRTKKRKLSIDKNNNNSNNNNDNNNDIDDNKPQHVESTAGQATPQKLTATQYDTDILVTLTKQHKETKQMLTLMNDCVQGSLMESNQLRLDLNDFAENAIESRTSLVTDIELVKTTLKEQIDSLDSKLDKLQESFDKMTQGTQMFQTTVLRQLDSLNKQQQQSNLMSFPSSV